MKTQSETDPEEPREPVDDREDLDALRDWLDLEDYPLDEAGYGHGV